MVRAFSTIHACCKSHTVRTSHVLPYLLIVSDVHDLQYGGWQHMKHQVDICANILLHVVTYMLSISMCVSK